MHKLAIEGWMGAISIGILAATACTIAPAATSDSLPPPPPAAAVATEPPHADVDAGAPQRAEFGLDQRPSNKTCIAPARPPATGALKLEPVFAGVNLEQTIGMAQRPGDATRWFVASRTGKIVSFPVVNPPAEPTVVADLALVAGKPVETDLSGGLLGIAFHPGFATNGRLYVTFTTSSAGGHASEVGYLASTDGGASFTSYTKVFSFDRAALEWNGGGIAFGKDGDLFVAFGSDATPNPQSTTSYFGKVLRIDVDHPADGRPYGIPTNNPFKAGGGAPEIFALGFRNPFRLSVDRETGDLWVGDVGQDNWEEVDRVEVGRNYGWPCREGAHDFQSTNAAVCPSTAGLSDPVFEYPHVAPSTGSVTGGIVYRGAAMPGFQGTYVYGDFMMLQASALTFDATGHASSVLINESGPNLAFTTFTEDNDGEIYGTSVLENKIYKLVPASAPVASSFPDRLSKTGCFDAADPKKPAPGTIPYGVNVPLWSDGAEKERTLAVPDGTTIGVKADGDFDFPIGSVLTKTFSLAGKRVETRLFVRHDDGEWAGYTYEWDDAQTDALLLPARKVKSVGAQTWMFPSRTDCVRCHGAAAGRTLGLELGQLNGDLHYASTARIANQLSTLEHIGLFAAPLGKPVSAIAAYPAIAGTAPVAERARAYLHSNCSMCHRPDGNSGRAKMDFRFSTSFADTKSCGVVPVVDDLGVANAKILAPGAPESSLISLRMHATDKNRMPALGTSVVDDKGVKVVDDWIRAATCP
jgi:uncharacterized repeat protein (TIGR03806 family)